jgi:hypothetical protein
MSEPRIRYYEEVPDWGFLPWDETPRDNQEPLPEPEPEKEAQANQSRDRNFRFGKLATAVAVLSVAFFHGDTKLSHEPKNITAEPPVTLPKAVQNDYKSIFQINDGNVEGTAFKVGNNLVFTAGHLVMPDGEGFPTRPLCGYQENIETPEDNFDDGLPQITNWFGQYGGPYASDTPDYALAEVDSSEYGSDYFSKLPKLKFANSTAKVGQVVYYINYQAIFIPKKMYRVPSEYDLPYYYNSDYVVGAAEFAGIVIKVHGDEYDIATGFQSYGQKKDQQTNLQHGGSGGPIIDSEGEVIGISNLLEGQKDVASIDKYDDMTLPADPSGQVYVAGAAKITPSLFDYAKEELFSDPNKIGTCND